MEKTSLDRIDRNILARLQRDADLPLAELAKAVGLSPSPCWRRVKLLEEAGYITRRVALLDAAKLNAGVTVFVFVRTSRHSKAWLEGFAEAVQSIPEVVEFYRMSGDIDYLLKLLVPDIAGYDRAYKRLIEAVELSDVTSAFAMEQIKFSTEVPLDFVAWDR